MILVLSIALQSLTTVVSENHKIDIEHLQTQHDHDSDSNSFDNNSDEDGHNINDCHHCGHCSGSHLSWIVVNSLNGPHKLFSNNNIPYEFYQTKEFLDAILRPPIS